MEQIEVIANQEACPLVVVVGPTASGKTRLAVELAKAFDGEVVSADSMQVYRQMSIATAKPTEEEMQGVPHHLLDFVKPDDAAFSVAAYTAIARGVIGEIAARGKLPILAGGTGLYIDGITKNIDYSTFPGDTRLREKLEGEAAHIGNEAMLERLSRVDPELAEKLHPNNLGRILRALEIYQATGLPLSQHQRHAVKGSCYRLCMLGINYKDRALLYQRVNQRVDEMIEQGLVEEAREIRRIYGGTARQAIGYKELEPYFQGLLPLETCIERLKQATRNYAKRQLSWFRRDQRITWLYPDVEGDLQELFTNAQLLVHKSKIL